jgi:hypothetical protein
MKQTKKNIKSNKKRITKKYNYRKNKKGGLNFFSRNPNIKTDIDKIQRGFENIKISFPFKDMHMDLSLPDKHINQSIDEWAKQSCFDPIKTRLQTSIARSVDLPTPEPEIVRNNQILTYIQTQTATPLNFSVIPDVIMFITNPYDISVIKKKSMDSLIEKNNFVDGILQPKQEVAAEQEITLPKEVVVLVRVMQQLTREIDTNTIYINGIKQPKFPIDEADKIDHIPGEFLYNTACKGYGQLLNNIRRMYRGTTVLDWNIVNTQILTCFLLDSPFYNYFINFVENFLDLNIDPTSNNHFYYAKAKRDGDGSLIPKVSIDTHIRTYKDKYIDAKFFNLDPITEKPEDGNFLQYVKNDNTCLIKINTNIIIETVQVYYVYLTGEINAKTRISTGKDYDGLIIAAIVEKKITNIIEKVIHYSSQFRWLITKTTIENLYNNNINFSENILKDMKTVRMSGDNRFVKWVKGSYRNKDTTASDENISDGSIIPESRSSIIDPNQKQLNLVENSYDEKDVLTRQDTIDWPTATYTNKKRYNEVGGKTRKKLLKRKRK